MAATGLVFCLLVIVALASHLQQPVAGRTSAGKGTAMNQPIASASPTADGGSAAANHSMPTPRSTAAGGSAANYSTPTPRPTTGGGSAAPGGSGAAPGALYGVTLDDVSNITGIVDSLSHLTHKPTARIVFDYGQTPQDYAQAVQQIHQVAYTLGMPADSSTMKQYTPATYSQRVKDYLSTFGSQVDIWEVGNEINGEWLGNDSATKMVDAYNLVKQAGKLTALTLYYNGLDDTNNCYANKNNLMFRWAQANIPSDMKQGLDYVFISYYEQDCPGVSKDWTSIFSQLHQMFPHSRLGFGENGTHEASDPASLKLQYIREYYPHWVNVPCYVAGHFWWYFAEDGVPYRNNQLWSAINDSMNALVVPQDTTCGAFP